MDRVQAEIIIREALGGDADRLLGLAELGLDPVEFIKAALVRAAREFGRPGTKGTEKHRDEEAVATRRSRGGRSGVRQPRTSPPPPDQPCFEVKSTATDLLDPLQTAIFVSAGNPPDSATQRRFAEDDRKAGRKVEPISLIIQQSESLRFADIVRGIVRGATAEDEQAFAEIRPKSLRYPSAGRVNAFELQILQCIAMLKNQSGRPGASKVPYPYVIHRASSTVLGRGSIGLVHDAEEKMRPAIQRWSLWTRLRRHAHTAKTSEEAIAIILKAFARQTRPAQESSK